MKSIINKTIIKDDINNQDINNQDINNQDIKEIFGNQKKTRKTTKDFFDKLILEQENNEIFKDNEKIPELENKYYKPKPTDIFRKNKEKVDEIPLGIQLKEQIKEQLKDKVEIPIQTAGKLPVPDRYTIYDVDGLYKMHINNE